MTLEMRRHFNAPRERVFAAWTELQQLEQWMCRDNPSQDAKYTALDVRPGGRYVIEIPISGGLYRGHGEFREVSPPSRLVFTWAWERIPPKLGDGLQTTDCIITVQLIAQGDATEMLFTQEQIEGKQSFDDHMKGWSGCFDVLAEALAADATVPSLTPGF